MNRKKLSGSFYTPKIVAEFLADYLSNQINFETNISILEPSAGDGIFVKSVIGHPLLSKKIKRVVAVEQNAEEVNKIKMIANRKVLQAFHEDFLNFQASSRRKFNLVIGNPPYIKKNHLTNKQIRQCKEIHERASLLDHEPRNIWTAFLVRCIEFTNSNGILAFILPAEILQVKFAEELRQLLHESFERVEYFSFQELIFEAEGQNTIMLIGYRRSNCPGIYFATIDRLPDLLTKNFSLKKNDIIRGGSAKEIHHNISSDDLIFLNNLKKQLKSIASYTTSKPGIVTAANQFFIVNKLDRRKYALAKFTKPIIQRGAFVNGKVELNKRDWEKLSEDEFPCYLLDFNRIVISNEGNKLQSYLRLGKKLEINNRYKCLERERWYEVPNITTPSQALFFKRCHHYPKLLKNAANVYVTDSAYMVNPTEGHLIDSIIYSFYNSLTLLFAELGGRYYGGGVLELTPSEFKNLPLPYLNTNSEVFQLFTKEFALKSDITTVLAKNDPIILNQILGLDSSDIERLTQIRNKLLCTRLKVQTLRY